METSSACYRIIQCSKCQGDREYTCVSCPCYLCAKCKEIHVKDLKTIDHDAVINRRKLSFFGKHREANIIKSMRSDDLFYRSALLKEMKADVKTCQTEFFLFQSEMLSKTQRVKDLINDVLNDLKVNVFCDFNFKHRCLKQKVEMVRHLASLQRYVHKYEQAGIRPLKFISFIKKVHFSLIHLTLHTNQHSMTESLNKGNVIKNLTGVQITEKGNKHVEVQRLLKIMPRPELHQHLEVAGVDSCNHITYVKTDRLWVSDNNNLFLTNKIGDIIYHRKDLNARSVLYNGVHTITDEGELIYLDEHLNINKLSKDMRKATIYVEKAESQWVPTCVYWSSSTRDLLVGMYGEESRTGKVARYNQSGQLTHVQTLHHGNTGLDVYVQPFFITENYNGDVVVSDWNRAVVVTEHGGRYRFSYTGHSPELGLQPGGICTDVLSHIIVCDYKTSTVQLLDKNGQFLSHLLIRPSGIFSPCSLSYDVNTHRLWVGSYNNNTVCVYRYITQHDNLTGESNKS